MPPSVIVPGDPYPSEEATSASNVGTGGVGIYKQESGNDLEFKKINAGSTKVTVTDDAANNEIDIDVVPNTIVAASTDSRLSDARTPILGADDNFVTDAEKVKLANLSNTNTGDQTLPTDATIATTDVTTNNVSSTKHGWCPKHPNDTAKYLRGDGTWATPAGGSEAFPIGAVFLSVVSTDPATLLGYGTWSAIAAGKMLVGLDSGDIDFDTAEETGGAKTKTIAQANLPNISTGAGTAHTHVQDTHNHVITELRDATTGGATTNIALTADTTSTLGTKVTGSKVATNQTEAAHTHSLGGSGTALNVVNPYFVVYIWKRTA